MSFIQAMIIATAALTLPANGADGFQVAQRDGVVVFSRRVGREFHLMAKRGDRPARRLPVAPGGTPFDVEVALDNRRRLIVAFARCRASGPIDEYLGRLACRLGVVPADGSDAEQPLGPPPARDVSYRHPALQGGRLAFMRRPDRGGPVEVILEGKVILSLGGRRETGELLGLDLARYGIAAAIEVFESDLAFRQIYLKRPGRRAQVVAAGATGIENNAYVTTPTFSGPHLYWGYANHGFEAGTKRSYVFRRELSTGTTTGTVLSPYVTSIAPDAGRPDAPLIVTTDTGLDSPHNLSGTQAVRRLDAPRYTTVPRKDLIYP